MTPAPSKASQPDPAPHVPWRTWKVGMRVVVRRRLPEGGFGDALGDITMINSDGLQVRTRRGLVWVAAETIFLGKPVPPPPVRRPRRQEGS